jgi:hypothetical protein
MISPNKITKLRYKETIANTSTFETEKGEIITLPVTILIDEKTPLVNKKVVINNNAFILLVFNSDAVTIPVELFNIECVLECVDNYLSTYLKNALQLGFVLLRKELYEFKIVYHNEYVTELNNGKTLVDIPLRKSLWFKETKNLLKDCLYVLNSNEPMYHVNMLLKTNYKGIFISENFLVSFIPIKSLTQNSVLLMIVPASYCEIINTQEILYIVPTLKYQITDLLEKIKGNVEEITEIKKEISHLDVVESNQQRLLGSLAEIKTDVKLIEKDLYTKASLMNFLNTIRNNKRLVIVLWTIISLFFIESYLVNTEFILNLFDNVVEEGEVNNAPPSL